MLKILIGVIVELLSIIPSLLLVQFFRSIRSRSQQISPWHQALYKLKPNLEMFVKLKIKFFPFESFDFLVKTKRKRNHKDLHFHGGVYLLHMVFVHYW
jgi:hypothetical protein